MAKKKETKMNDQFMKQAEGFMQAAKDVRVPENFQAMAEEGVARTRDAYEKITTVAKDANGVMESVADVATRGCRQLGERAFENLSANAEAALDAAEAVARARTLPEAAKLQADYFQQMFTVAGEQTKEFFELSNQVAMETADQMNELTTRALDSTRG